MYQALIGLSFRGVRGVMSPGRVPCLPQGFLSCSGSFLKKTDFLLLDIKQLHT
ncbi:hypothetical protein SXCC_02858 [Gluconacetobacter sp. SXCC-1]|nr:hypothetical protein SXCC_02858 [Gluconacetobacter sp. SXCC-1]